MDISRTNFNEDAGGGCSNTAWESDDGSTEADAVCLRTLLSSNDLHRKFDPADYWVSPHPVFPVSAGAAGTTGKLGHLVIAPTGFGPLRFIILGQIAWFLLEDLLPHGDFDGIVPVRIPAGLLTIPGDTDVAVLEFDTLSPWLKGELPGGSSLRQVLGHNVRSQCFTRKALTEAGQTVSMGTLHRYLGGDMDFETWWGHLAESYVDQMECISGWNPEQPDPGMRILATDATGIACIRGGYEYEVLEILLTLGGYFFDGPIDERPEDLLKRFADIIPDSEGRVHFGKLQRFERARAWSRREDSILRHHLQFHSTRLAPPFPLPPLREGTKEWFNRL